MKKFISCLILFSQISLAFAVDPYQTKPRGALSVCSDENFIDLPNLPPVMDQGNYGVCYAHSSLVLLEYLRCSQSPSPQSCYANKGSVLHLARFNNTYGKEISIGGAADNVVDNFKYLGRKLSKASCAPYEKWAELDKTFKENLIDGSPELDQGESDFFYYLSKKLADDNSYETRQCWAQDIIDSGVKSNLSDVMNILSKSQEMAWQELRYKILVPEQCLKDPILYPDYEIIPFPRRDNENTPQGFKDQIHRSLASGYPVEASFQAEVDPSGNPLYHSATIVGQRQVCTQDECILQYRIQNSYGASWQDYNDNGWVNADNLIDLMDEPGLGIITLIPKGKSLNTQLKAPTKKISPRGTSSTNSSGRCRTIGDAPMLELKPQEPPQLQPGADPSKIYICKQEGRTIFTDSPSLDMHCKEM